MNLADIGRLVGDVSKSQQGIVTSVEGLTSTLEEVQKAQEAVEKRLSEGHDEMKARMQAFEEKMSDEGVGGYGDVEKGKGKFVRAYSVGDFLRVVRARTNGIDLKKEQLSFHTDPYPEEHVERIMSSEVSADGGFAVPEFMSPDIIERLKAMSVLEAAGIRSFTVPVNFGNFVVPRLASGVTYGEIGENATPALSTPQLELVTASPKRVSVGVEASNRLLESNAVNLDDIITNDAVDDGALRADFLGLRGSGTSFQPRGVVNTPNIGSVIAGTPDGGPVTLDLLIDLQKDVNEANSKLRSTAYIMHSNIFFQMLKILEGSQHVVASPFFPPGPQGKPPKQIWGEKILTFNDLPVNLTKASGTDLGEVFFADWSDLVKVIWGGMTVTMTKEATHPTSGRSAFWNKITGFLFDMEIDYYTRHAGSFSVSTDVETL